MTDVFKQSPEQKKRKTGSRKPRSSKYKDPTPVTTSNGADRVTDTCVALPTTDTSDHAPKPPRARAPRNRGAMKERKNESHNEKVQPQSVNNMETTKLTKDGGAIRPPRQRGRHQRNKSEPDIPNVNEDKGGFSHNNVELRPIVNGSNITASKMLRTNNGMPKSKKAQDKPTTAIPGDPLHVLMHNRENPRPLKGGENRQKKSSGSNIMEKFNFQKSDNADVILRKLGVIAPMVKVNSDSIPREKASKCSTLPKDSQINKNKKEPQVLPKQKMSRYQPAKPEENLFKVVLRGLPHKMNEEQFLEQLGKIPPTYYYRFAPPNQELLGIARPRAYFAWAEKSTVLEFAKKWNGCSFVDDNGNSSSCVVELAPFMDVPGILRENVGKDKKVNEVEKLPVYKQFVDDYNAQFEEKPLTMAEQLEELQKKQEERKQLYHETPLTDFWVEKEFDRMKSRMEKAKIQRSAFGTRRRV